MDISIQADKALGNLVAQVAIDDIATAIGEGRAALRVSGFDDEIVRAAVASLVNSLAERRDLYVVVKVGTSEPTEGIPEDYLLKPGEQLTAWRNRTKVGGGLILFDWGTPADDQGLRAISQLDGEILFGPDRVDDTFARLSQEGWHAAGGVGKVPDYLRTGQKRVWDAINNLGEESRSLRRLARYIVESAQLALADHVRVQATIDFALQSALPSLGLFSDADLFSEGVVFDNRIRKNVRVSALQQPSGALIPDEDILDRIASTQFSPERLLSAGLSAEEARTSMRDFVMTSHGRETYMRTLDLGLWLELFERNAKKQGLGTRIREWLAENEPARVHEYEDLGIAERLDEGEQEAAETLLSVESTDGDDTLFGILPAVLRRRAEKVAYPSSVMTADPLRAVLRELPQFDDEESGTVGIRLEGSKQTGIFSRWLFGFLYGATLLEVEEAAGLRLAFAIDPQLVPADLPRLPPPEEPFDDELYWAPLTLSLDFDGAPRRRLSWAPLQTPGLIALAAFICGSEVQPGENVNETFDGFLERWNDPREWVATEEVQGLTYYAAAARDMRQEHFLRLGAGLSASRLEDYSLAWGELAAEARQELVPANAPSIDLQNFVLSDVVRLLNGRLLMLGTHPLRLRWLSRHLSRMSDLITTALTDRLRLNPENDDLFFEAIGAASPHGTPAVVVSTNQTVAVPTREAAGHEEFAPIRERGNQSRDWLSAVDQTAIDEMVKVVRDYVSTYPHKLDGLNILLLDRNGDPLLPVRVAKAVKAGNGQLRFNLVVLAPEGSHHAIIQEFDEEFSGVDISHDRLLPDVQLVLQTWQSDVELDHRILEGTIDIALAPSLFGTQISLKESTRASQGVIVGRYDAWTHAGSHEIPVVGQNMVREFLPSTSDGILETWSTLCVRSHRQSAVAREKVANTDYFEMQVEFDHHQQLFFKLHQIAHWVVTLDSLVGRNQIDNLQERPDIILVKPRVGKNEAYTLIVSSATGKKLVAERLRKRLLGMGVVDPDTAGSTAARLYSVSRNIAPGAVLRSLGIGTSINEIVGLVVSRFVVAQRYPLSDKSKALEVWISFDEQHRWFGRNLKTRADLGRFVLKEDATGGIELDVLVVESKFRQTYDHGSAEEQLSRTTNLCRHAFESNENALDDHGFWRLELASAIEQVSGQNLFGSELPSRRQTGPSDENFQTQVVEELRSGSVRLNSVHGVAVAVAAGSTEPAPESRWLGEHELIRVNRPELQQIVGLLRAGHDPYVGPAQEFCAATGGERRVSGSAAVGNPCSNGKPGVQDSDGGESASSNLVCDESDSHQGLGERELAVRYNTVLDVFNLHNVAVSAPSKLRAWQEGPGYYILRFVPNPGVPVDRLVNRRHEIFLALELPSGFEMRVVSDRGAVVFEIPKVEDEKFGVSTESLWEACPLNAESLKAPVGTDIEGLPVEIEFSSPESPHLLVAGTTGSGKSVALDTILRGLLRYEPSRLRLQLIDPKGTELVDFEGDSHVDGLIGMDAEDAIAILSAAVEEMAARYGMMKVLRTHNLVEYNKKVEAADRLPWRVIVLDEYADLTSDPEQKKQIEVLLKRLAQKARAAGIHVIIATQRPSADVISSTIRSNFPAQLALRVKSATDSRIIIDEPGAEALAGRGDALLSTGVGVRRIQVGYHAGH